MTTNTANSHRQEWQNASSPGTRVCFGHINAPGCYICEWSGHLLRVPPDGIAPGRSPLVTMVGCEPLYVIKVCNDPFIPITKARILAADYDLSVNF